jgi:hypothetical protein
VSTTKKGNTDVRLVNSRLEDREDDGKTLVLTYRGARDKAAAWLRGHKVGDKFSDWGQTLPAKNIAASVLPGGLVEIVVSCAEGDATGGGGSGSSTANEVVSIDYTLVAHPIETHPKFATLRKSHLDQYTKFRRWFTIPDDPVFAAIKAAFKTPSAAGLAAVAADENNTTGLPDPDTAAHWEELAGDALALAKLKDKGIEDYLVVVPVVRRTTTAVACGNRDTSCGKRATDVPGRFKACAKAWLKTVSRWSRSTRTGRWTHEEEWSGFEELDETLYP